MARRAGSATPSARWRSARRWTSLSRPGRRTNASTWSSRRANRVPRRAFAVIGKRPCSRFSSSVMARSRRGRTQAGVRWNTVSFPTCGWIAGTIWAAEAPVPTIATRLPASGKSWSQREEWNTLPGKESRPGSSGICGSASGPAAATTASAVQRPAVVVICQRVRSTSQRASVTSVLKRRWGRRPKTSATFSR